MATLYEKRRIYYATSNKKFTAINSRANGTYTCNHKWQKMWVNRDTNGYSHLVGEHWDGSITLFMVTSKGQIIEDTKSVLVTGRGGTWNEFEEE